MAERNSPLRRLMWCPDQIRALLQCSTTTLSSCWCRQIHRCRSSWICAASGSPSRKLADSFNLSLRVAEHFGLHQEDFQFIGASDQTADDAFLNGKADAIFRVRAIGSPSIQKLVQSGKIRFLPIEHAAAMKINHPAFEPAVIPEGAYMGNPSVPAQDLPTVSVQRTLLARDTANAAAIQAITQVLMERRQEMMQEIPANMPEVRLLLVHVRRPETQLGMGPSLHTGALGYYDKDKPSFLLAHADYVGLILTIGLMVGSWIWELKRWMQRQQKNTADQYGNRVIALIAAAQDTKSTADLDHISAQLVTILTEAVRDSMRTNSPKNPSTLSASFSR